MGSWKEVKIGDFLYRTKRPIALNPNDEYKLVTIKMHHKGIVLRGLKKGADIKSKMYEVKKGDFILSGIDARNGAFGIVPQELDGAIVTNDFWYFKLDEDVIDKHFFLELTSTSWFDEICRLGSDGTTQRIRLQKDKFFNQEINIPPLEEQQDFISKFKSSKTVNTDIANEIETQQALLKKLRQSIRQEAIEGKLTASWREQNPDVESASVLLEKIKAEKEQLVKDKKNKKQKTLPLINEDEIPFDIPGSWEWCRLLDIADGFQYGTSSKSSKEGLVPVLRMGNLQNGKVVMDDFVFSNDKKEVDKYKLSCNDLLFNRTNSRELVGKTAIYNYNEKAIYAGYLVRFNMVGKILPQYINYLMNSNFHRDWCDEFKTDAIGQSNINATKLKSYRVSLPPLEEQEEIVKKIENLFKICDELETQIDSSKANSEMLMQAVLKEAFADDH